MAEVLTILHLISTLDVGGAERNLLRLVQAMDREDFKPVVVSMTDIGPVGRQIERSGIPVHALAMAKGRPDPRGIRGLHQLLAQYNPDIIQSWMYHANLLGLLALNSSRLVWNLRCSNMDLESYGPVYRWSVRAGARCSRLPAAVIANSHAGKDHHTRLGYRPRSWHVIPNGFDTAIFRPDEAARSRVRRSLSIPPDATVIGFVARQDPMKDHACFFRAAEDLHHTHPEVHFVLAGRGVERTDSDIAAIMPTLTFPQRFHLLGERDDIPALLAALDIAAACSHSEGLPNAVGEAMAAGLPCVASDVGDTRRLVADCGRVVPPSDPQAMCHAWQELVDAGADYRRALGIKARDRISDHFGIAAMKGRYEEMYMQLHPGRRPPVSTPLSTLYN